MLWGSLLPSEAQAGPALWPWLHCSGLSSAEEPSERSISLPWPGPSHTALGVTRVLLAWAVPSVAGWKPWAAVQALCRDVARGESTTLVPAPVALLLLWESLLAEDVWDSLGI